MAENNLRQIEDMTPNELFDFRNANCCDEMGLDEVEGVTNA